MADIPMWAQRMIATVAHEHRRKQPDISWRPYRGHARTAGSADGNGISLTTLRHRRIEIKVPGVHCSRKAKHELSDAKRVLLHELAHWLTDEGHTEVFWVKAFELYRRFRLNIGAALRDEASYRRGALAGYWAGRGRQGRRPTSHVFVSTRISAGPPL